MSDNKLVGLICGVPAAFLQLTMGGNSLHHRVAIQGTLFGTLLNWISPKSLVQAVVLVEQVAFEVFSLQHMEKMELNGLVMLFCS